MNEAKRNSKRNESDRTPFKMDVQMLSQGRRYMSGNQEKGTSQQ